MTVIVRKLHMTKPYNKQFSTPKVHESRLQLNLMLLMNNYQKKKSKRPQDILLQVVILSLSECSGACLGVYPRDLDGTCGGARTAAQTPGKHPPPPTPFYIVYVQFLYYY